MTEVALMENAFWRMRDPEQDSDEVYDSYRAMRKRLRDQMAEDGLDRQEVVTLARMIIGERMVSEPELRLMFNGLAHGRIVKAPPHEGRIAGSSRLLEVWSGEFDDQLGNPIPPDGMFTLRRPMDAHAHQVQLAETMAGSMLDGLQRDDQGAYAGSIMGYLVGFTARKEGLDTRGLPDVLQRRIDQSESMLASMDIDGLPSEKQQEIYSNAFTDAMEEIGRQHPGVEEALRLSFGGDWPSALQEAVDDPARFVNEQRMRPKVYQTGPDHPMQHERRLRLGLHGEAGRHDGPPAGLETTTSPASEKETRRNERRADRGPAAAVRVGFRTDVRLRHPRGSRPLGTAASAEPAGRQRNPAGGQVVTGGAAGVR